VFFRGKTSTESGIRRDYAVQKVFHGAFEHHFSVFDTSRLWAKGRLCFLYSTRLLHLLVSGLSNYPTEQILLSGLGYFHEHRNILSQIISSYTNACKKETDIEKFRDLCVDFINDTDADGYSAISELKSIFKEYRDKLDVLKQIETMMQYQDEVIKFYQNNIQHGMNEHDYLCVLFDR